MNNMVCNDLVIDRDQQEIIDSVEIEFELYRLLTERRFRSSPQMAAFLRYIVDETLKGNAPRIKAYTVGVDALGKPVTFDAQGDPSVRVLASRVRKALTEMYAADSPARVRIEMVVGSYVPVFSINRIQEVRQASTAPGIE